MRRFIARRLESNTAPAALRALSLVWQAMAHPVRELSLPHGVHCIGVAGPTLGGSSKTPMLLELTRWLAERQVRCAVVASAYWSTVRQTCRVRSNDPVELVGDEALWLARALQPLGVPVFVGPRRELTLAYAGRVAQVVLLDAVLQTRPQRLNASLLTVDVDTPWHGYCPPAGDLRAAPLRMVAASDYVLLHRFALAAPAVEMTARSAGKPVLHWSDRIAGAFAPDGYVPVEQLGALRLGLVLNVARPGRVQKALAEHGIVPVTVELGADHARPRMPRRRPRIEAWVTTPKCATKLGHRWAGAPVWVLDRRLELPDKLPELVLQRGLVSGGAVVWSAACRSEA